MRKIALPGLIVAMVLGASYLPCSAAIHFSFLIDGDTFTQPFSITNSSDAGETVTRFQLDLSPVPGLVFDPVDGSPPNNTLGVPFTPVGGTDVTTGLLGLPVIPDGSTLLDISFNDFEPGETFSWDIDVDTASGPTVTGDEMIGALATIDFSNGLTLLGVLEAVPGNPDATTFSVTGTVPTGNVPEPSSLMVFSLIIGLVTVGNVQRRRSFKLAV